MKYILNKKEYDVIHAHSPHVGFLLLLAKLFIIRRTLPTVMTVHDSYPNFKPRNRLLLLPVFAGFRRIVCCSRSSLESFPSIYKRLAGDRLSFVQNGLDIARVDRIAAQSLHSSDRSSGRAQPKNAFTVVAISRLVRIKNPFTLLTAFSRSADKNCQMVYIGDGPLRAQLLAQKQYADIGDQIEFTGLIPREKVFEYLLNADLFISTSYGEGLPVSVMEAMSCRCPVLLSDIPPHRELAETVDFIPLIDPDDSAGFSREIKRFSEMSVSERISIGEKCRKLVVEQFSLATMHAGYLAIYDQVANTHVAPILEMA